MSIYYTLRSYWWDISLLVRHLRLKGKRAWWGVRITWKNATPSIYHSLQAVHRRFCPARKETGYSELYSSVVTVDGIRMRIDSRMTPLQVRKLVSGRHTRNERRLIIPRLEPNDVVMELGGGIGMLAIACALKIGDDRVHSYEANPYIESLTRENYELNNVNPQLKMCMLGRTAGSHKFYVSEHFSKSSAYKSPGGKASVCEVPVEPLNDEIRRIQPTVLIIDIQGSECELLSFADLSTIQKLLVEVHPTIIGIFPVNAVRRSLRKQGFLEIERSGQSFLYIRP